MSCQAGTYRLASRIRLPTTRLNIGPRSAPGERWTVSLGLSQLAGSIAVPTTVLMAGAVIVTLPIVVLSFATGRFLVGGLTGAPRRADRGPEGPIRA